LPPEDTAAVADQTCAANPVARFADTPLPGLVSAFRVRTDGVAEQLDIDQPVHAEAGEFLWLHFNLTNALACAQLRNLSDIPAEAIRLLVTKSDHQQLDTADGYVFGVIADFSRKLGGVSKQIGFLHFVMSHDFLITGRRNALNAVESARQALSAGRRVNSVARLFELIVDHVADAIDNLADRLAVDMDRIEERILDGAAAAERAELGTLRRTTVRVHRQLAGLRSIFQRADQDGLNELPPPLRIEAERLSQRLEGIDHEVEALRERARVLQEEVSNQLCEETNRHLRALTIVTIMFLPPTLIAGFFGMNLKDLPFENSETGFWSGVIVAFVSSVLVYGLLRWFGITISSPRR
jgi:zinc transporter